MRSKKAIINIISSLLLQLITVICGLIIPRAIIGHFGSSVNGLITSITQFLSYITLLEAGFGPVVKSILYKPIASKNKQEIERIFKASEKFFKSISYIFLIYIVVLCFILPIVVSDEFDAPYTISLIVIISISTFAEYYLGMVYKLYLQAEQKTYITSTIQMVTTILNTIMVVFLVYCGASIQVVKLVSAVIFVARPILQSIYVKRKYNIRLKNTDNSYEIKQKWDGLSQHIAYVIHNNVDVTILTFFTNTKEVSVYSVYLMVVQGLKNLVQSFTGGIDATFGDMIAKNEKENLKKTFKIYELFYFSIITIIFSTAMVMILPFIRIYTSDITDVEYLRPTFAYLIVLSEFVWAIRLPYSSISTAAGHFKQTKRGAWVEALTNVILSIILVFKFGIVGVAIGTLVAMAIRTLEFVYHSSKYILERSTIYTLKKIALLLLEATLIIIVCNVIPKVNITNYINWAIQSGITVIISLIVVGTVNILVYKNTTKQVIEFIKKIISKRKDNLNV